jgi:hypothetical protein
MDVADISIFGVSKLAIFWISNNGLFVFGSYTYQICTLLILVVFGESTQTSGSAASIILCIRCLAIDIFLSNCPSLRFQ